MSKEVQIQCSAYSKISESKGFAEFSREFNLNHPLPNAIDYARAVFFRMLKEEGFAQTTVRVCIDVALPEGWCNDAKVQTSEEVPRRQINTSTKSA